jgi:hypothetical protein
MLGKDALCRNRKRDLRQFLRRFCAGLDKTRVKFFRQSLWGILNSGSLTVSKWLRWIAHQDSCKLPFYRHKRLLNQLKSKDWDHAAVLQSYQRQWASLIQPDTPLIIDLTDLPRPRGRKMPYIRLVRDGSEDRLRYGYWCVEIYAYWGKGRITPLLLHPYSTEAPDVLGENAQILASVDRVLAATAGQGVLVMDRGADRDHLLIPWIDDHRRFVIRLRGDRHLLLDNGAMIPAATLAEQLLQKASDGRRAWCRVYLPERPQHPLHLVCKILPGRDKPLILLTSLTAQDLNTARNVLSYYRRRWKCEEAARFLKTDLGIERFALRLYESFPRLFLLACLAMSFLTWLALRFDSLSKALRAKAPGRHPVKFLYYRLLDWLRNQFQHAPLAAEPP